MSNRRIEDLDTRIQPLVTELLKRANELTKPWLTFITDGFRTYAEQAEIYASGRTKEGKILTNAKPGTSNHEKGLAADIAFQNGGKLSYDDNLYKKIVPIAKELGFTWGGDWKDSPDRPHFEKLTFSSTPVVVTPPAATNPSFNDQTKIPVGGEWGDVELQAVRGLLGDLVRSQARIKELEQQIEKLEGDTLQDIVAIQKIEYEEQLSAQKVQYEKMLLTKTENFSGFELINLGIKKLFQR